MIDGDPVNKKIPLSGCMPQRKGGIVLQKIAFAAPVPSPGGEAAALPAVEGLSHVNLCSEWEGERAQTAHLLSCLMHSHLCVVTRDMEKTLAYYERVLGAKPSRHVLRCPYTYAAANAYPKGAVYALIRGGQAEQDLRGAKTGGKILEFKSPGEKEIRIGFASLPGPRKNPAIRTRPRCIRWRCGCRTWGRRCPILPGRPTRACCTASRCAGKPTCICSILDFWIHMACAGSWNRKKMPPGHDEKQKTTKHLFCQQEEVFCCFWCLS